MNHPKGFVCLLQRGRMRQVPTSVQDLRKLLHLLMNVASMKVSLDCLGVDQRLTSKPANHQGLCSSSERTTYREDRGGDIQRTSRRGGRRSGEAWVGGGHTITRGVETGLIIQCADS